MLRYAYANDILTSNSANYWSTPLNTYVAVCTYRVREGQDEAFLALMRNHVPTLRRLGLLAEEPSLLFQGKDESGKTFVVEVLRWKSEEAPDLAEQMPDVLRLWEGLGKLVEARLGRPAMEFPHMDEISNG